MIINKENNTDVYHRTFENPLPPSEKNNAMNVFSSNATSLHGLTKNSSKWLFCETINNGYF